MSTAYEQSGRVRQKTRTRNELESGRYPEEEGYSLGPVSPEGLTAIIWGFGYERVAVRGPMLEGDGPETVSFFDAAEFVGIFA